LKTHFRAIPIRIIILIGALSLVTACANLGDKSADTDDCREIAYSKQNESIRSSADNTFSQCQRQKDALREDVNSQESTFLWVEFFLDLFVSSHSANE
jgi:hypothetical protein